MEDKSVDALWLTRNMANRLVVEAVRIIDNSTKGVVTDAPSIKETAHQFDQQAAMGALRPQQPVKVDPDSGDASFQLVTQIKMSSEGGKLLIDFNTKDGSSRTVPFNMMELRQWLSVMYRNYSAAKWTEDIWPSWIDASFEAPSPSRLN